jgi:hypothetical protein
MKICHEDTKTRRRKPSPVRSAHGGGQGGGHDLAANAVAFGTKLNAREARGPHPNPSPMLRTGEGHAAFVPSCLRGALPFMRRA